MGERMVEASLSPGSELTCCHFHRILPAKASQDHGRLPRGGNILGLWGSLCGYAQDGVHAKGEKPGTIMRLLPTGGRSGWRAGQRLGWPPYTIGNCCGPEGQNDCSLSQQVGLRSWPPDL